MTASFDAVRRFVAGGEGRAREAVDAVLRDVPFPLDHLLAERAHDLPDLPSIERHASLLEELATRPTLSADERARTRIVLAILLARAGATERALRHYAASADRIRHAFPHLVRNAASWLAHATAGARSDQSVELLKVALGGPPSTASVGIYRRALEAAHALGELARPALAACDEAIAEAWLYLRLDGGRSKFKGLSDELQATARPDDKRAAGHLLVEVARRPAAIRELSRRWFAEDLEQADPSAPGRAGDWAGAEEPPWRAQTRDLDELARAHRYRELEAACDARRATAELEAQMYIDSLRANAIRITRSQEAAWEIVDAACGEADRHGVDPLIVSRLQVARGWAALNMLRAWDALSSGRRAVCAAILSGDLAATRGALQDELHFATILGAHRKEQIQHALDQLPDAGRPSPYTSRSIGYELEAAADQDAFARALEEAGDLLHAAEAYGKAAKKMMDRQQQERRQRSRGMSLNHALERGQALAAALGAARLRYDVEGTEAARSLSDRHRARLLQHIAAWLAAATEIPIERERGGAIAHVARLVANLVEKTRTMRTDLRAHRDAWRAVQHLKGLGGASMAEE